MSFVKTKKAVKTEGQSKHTNSARRNDYQEISYNNSTGASDYGDNKTCRKL